MKILITGGCGFVGHHFVEHFLKETDYEIIIFDKLTYAASGYDRVRDIEAFDNRRVQFFALDITKPVPEGVLKETRDVRMVYHLAAESHVDNSIVDPVPFVLSNTLGTTHLLEYARNLPALGCFLYFSTDEVFGPALPHGRKLSALHSSMRQKFPTYREWDRYCSANPYAASKAGGEEMCLAYHNTHDVPVIITHTMNCFGERQHREKYIPKIIIAGLTGDTVTVHSYPDLSKAGSRFYIHCRNVAKIAHRVAEHGVIGEKYNIVGEKEVDNSELVDDIAMIMGGIKIKKEFVNFHSSRPGHDLRYALHPGKIKEVFPEGIDTKSFDESLEKTVRWYIENKHWLF